MNRMVGRKVRTYYGDPGEVIKWEPLGAASCDALVQRPDGTVCWHASNELVPADNKGPLSSRYEAQIDAMREARASLQKIRDDLIKEIEEHRRWAGCEFGKVHVLRSIDAALADLDKK